MHAHPTETAQPTDPDVVFSPSTDSFDCPDCGRTVVPTDDNLPDLRLEHSCPAATASPPAAAPPGSPGLGTW